MPIHPEVEMKLVSPVDEQFLHLVHSDAELLRAEFEAIIAAEWPDPPLARRQPGSRGPGRRQHKSWGSDRRLQDRPLGREAWRRERSPP